MKLLFYAYGSTAARTRLYRIGISNHLEEKTEDFEIFGELEHGWERYSKLYKLSCILNEIKR